MIDHVYTNGDSFTAGVEIQEHKSMDESNKALAYPMHFTNKLNIKHCDNRALPGATNEFILRRTILDLETYKTKGIDLSSVFVLIGWSNINKTEISMREVIRNIGDDPEFNFELMTNTEAPEYHLFQTKFVDPLLANEEGKIISDVYNESIDWLNNYMWDYELEYEKWYSYITLLKNYLENNNCKFLFHNTTHPCKVVSNIYQFDNYFQPNGKSFNEWCTTNNYERRELSYPIEDAHGDFADVLVSYVKEKNLL